MNDDANCVLRNYASIAVDECGRRDDDEALLLFQAHRGVMKTTGNASSSPRRRAILRTEPEAIDQQFQFLPRIAIIFVLKCVIVIK